MDWLLLEAERISDSDGSGWAVSEAQVSLGGESGWAVVNEEAVGDLSVLVGLEGADGWVDVSDGSDLAHLSVE